MTEKYYPLRDEAWEDELFDEIQVGDRVWYRNNVGQVCKAKAKFQGPHGWVCDRGNGQPVVINEGHNYLGHKKAKGRMPDHLGAFLTKTTAI